MSYFVTCTFDLERASRSDYENAYEVLATVGLHRTVVGSSGKDVVAPTTMTMGQFNGTSAAEVRDAVRERVRQAFSGQGFTSEIFIAVGGDWAWGTQRT